jgi:predicted ATPase/DNA-binding winged helix-turn-helix (wHTH) protein
MDGQAVSFGPYRLLTAQRVLLEGDRQVRLGSRAFDILAALVERAGQVVGKEELIGRAWPETFVEESNLKIQISALRRALGDGQGDNRYVITVPGRGYNFVAPVRVDEPPRVPLPVTIASAGVHNLPLALTRMIGREDAVATLVSRLSRERLLTVVGPGGVGKTTVALAVAERMIADYEHGVWVIDLAPLADPRLVPSTVATVLGLEVRSENPLAGLIAGLRDKRMLLLLDNCEHVIDAAASLAAAVLSGVPQVHILATSREPLGVAGEREHRLAPLGSPPTSSGLTAAEAMAFPAVQLFVERVSAVVEDFALTDANAAPIAEICQRLDGLPLAIEFAAPRVEVLGVEGLAAGLDQSLPLLTARRRTSTPRHRTMRTVIDWSYGLLSEDEQRFFRALGIFAGGFTVEAAAVVVTGAAETPCDAIDRLADLVAKSLVVADVSRTEPRFRLLDMTHAYAIEMLDKRGERERIARAHAKYYRNVFAPAEGEAATRQTDEWLADYAREIDNLRAALDWAFSPGGDRSAGVALVVAAIPVWLQLSMVDECRSRVEQALALVARETPIDARDEMKLQSALSASLLYTKGATPAAGQASATAMRLAESLGDTEYQLRALWELWVHRNNTGEYAAALAVAQNFYSLALKHADPATLRIADRIIGTSYHYLGDQTNAWIYIERMLSAEVYPHRRSPLIRFWFDEKVAGRIVLARILWLRGLADEAWRTVQSAVGDAEALGDRSTLCYAFSHGSCLVALWLGNLVAAECYAEMLLDLSRKHGFGPWGDFASRIKGVVLVKTGDLKTGSTLLRAGLDEINDPDFGLWFLTGLTELAEALGHAGRIAEGLAAIKRGIDQSQMSWLAPELLRIKGELLLLQGTAGTIEAVEDVFRQALDGARQQETLSWELRAATSLARLLHTQGRSADGLAILQPVYERFTEGFDTADLKLAEGLLAVLGQAGSGTTRDVLPRRPFGRRRRTSPATDLDESK